LEVTGGGRPPRESLKSKKVITSTMVVIATTVAAGAVACAEVTATAETGGVVVVLTTSETADFVVDVNCAVVDKLPAPVDGATAAAVDDEAVPAFDAPPPGLITPSTMSWMLFLSAMGFKTS
jgi:hypothetical protein